MDALDKGIIRVFTRFCNWFQRLTGKSNFFLAKIVILLASVSCLIDGVNYFFHILPYEASGFLFVVNASLVGSGLYRAYFCDRAEEKLFRGEGIRFAQLHTPQWFRLVLFFVAIFSIPSFSVVVTAQNPVPVFLSNAWPTEMFLFFYLTEVVPLPPGTSKVKQWIDSLRFATHKGEVVTVEN